MITKMTGTLTRVLDDELRMAIGPFEYQVMIPESVRRQVQMKIGQEMTLHISEYYEGNQSGTRLVPRRIGFQTEAELDFFDLFCTVDKIGVKKALKALSRPVKEIADAISRQDAKWLTTLPGIGAATAEQIISTLRRKVTKFAFAAASLDTESGGPLPTGSDVSAELIEDVYQALMALGHGPQDARSKLDTVLQSGEKFATVEDALTRIYSK
jgi:holliday junction DNA helicase RuvA